jgi:hypothetical protein
MSDVFEFDSSLDAQTRGVYRSLTTSPVVLTVTHLNTSAVGNQLRVETEPAVNPTGANPTAKHSILDVGESITLVGSFTKCSILKQFGPGGNFSYARIKIQLL